MSIETETTVSYRLQTRRRYGFDDSGNPMWRQWEFTRDDFSTLEFAEAADRIYVIWEGEERRVVKVTVEVCGPRAREDGDNE